MCSRQVEFKVVGRGHSKHPHYLYSTPSAKTNQSTWTSAAMDSRNVEVAFEIPKFIRVYKDGHAERLAITQFVPPSVCPSTGVSSKDVVIQPETGLSARLYLPKTSHKRIPLVIYFHGGGFIAESTSSPAYHPYLNSLVAEANVVALSVDYRRAPEHPLPIAYEDAWTAIHWVVSQSKQEEWFDKYVDFDRIFMGGDSSGANIAHHMAVRIGMSSDELRWFKIEGVFLIHPLFNGAQAIEDEAENPLMDIAGKTWRVVCPATTGLDDPLINPVKDVNFSKVGCRRILVCVAAKDGLRHRGRLYYENLSKCGWNGVVEFTETPGEDHVFFLYNLASQNAKDLITRVASFITTTLESK